MDLQPIYYGKKQLIRALGQSIESFFNNNNLYMKIKDAYTINIDLKHNGIMLEVQENQDYELKKRINEQMHSKTISILGEKVANLESAAAINDAQLKDRNKRIAEMESEIKFLHEEPAKLNAAHLESREELKEKKRIQVQENQDEEIEKRVNEQIQSKTISILGENVTNDAYIRFKNSVKLNEREQFILTKSFYERCHYLQTLNLR